MDCIVRGVSKSHTWLSDFHFQGVFILKGVGMWVGFWTLVRNIYFPGDSDDEKSTCNVGDQGSIPGLGRSSGEGNVNPLPVLIPGKFQDGEAWWATVHGVAKSWTRLNDFTFTFTLVCRDLKWDKNSCTFKGKMAWNWKNLGDKRQPRIMKFQIMLNKLFCTLLDQIN